MGRYYPTLSNEFIGWLSNYSLIKERKNELIRPVVANIDKVFIVTSLVEPDLNLNLLDRIICQAPRML